MFSGGGGGQIDTPPRTPLDRDRAAKERSTSAAAMDRDRSSTPQSSGSDDRQFVVKVCHDFKNLEVFFTNFFKYSFILLNFQERFFSE